MCVSSLMLARGYSVSTRLPGMRPAFQGLLPNLRRSSPLFRLAGRAQSIYSIPAESICQDCFQPLDIRCPTDEAERFSLVESFVASFDAVGSPEASRRTLESVNPSPHPGSVAICFASPSSPLLATVSVSGGGVFRHASRRRPAAAIETRSRKCPRYRQCHAHRWAEHADPAAAENPRPSPAQSHAPIISR